MYSQNDNINDNIKILLYSSLILSKYDSKDNVNNVKKIFKKHYNNDLLHINNNEFYNMKEAYSLTENELVDLISYMFINREFKYPFNNMILKENYIKELSNKLKTNPVKIMDSNPMNNKALINNISITNNFESRHQPMKNILGFVSTCHGDYNDIIKYTSEETLLKYDSKCDFFNYRTFNKAIKELLLNKEDISSINIKKRIDSIINDEDDINIHDNIDVLLPIAIISKFKPNAIFNINNDYGEWLYASYLLGVDHLTSVNHHEINDANIKKLFPGNKLIFSTNMTKKKIDLAYIDFSLLYEHDYNNYSYVIENDYFHKIEHAWNMLNNKGYLLIDLHDKKNDYISEHVNEYLLNKMEGVEFTGVLYRHKNQDLFPIWVFTKNTTVS